MDSRSLRSLTARALAWSALSNWSVKVLTLLLFVVLARLLSPQEMGVASAALLLAAFAAIASELGLPDAVLRQGGLSARALNGPALTIGGAGLLLGAALLAWPEAVAALLRTPDVAPYVPWVAGLPLLAGLASLLTAWHKRALQFGPVAIATLVATVVAGAAAVAAALAGLGPAAVILQSLLTSAVLVAFMLRSAGWRPYWRPEGASFRPLLRYAGPAYASKLLDFASTRLVELLILAKLGALGLGLYVVGSKLYQTLLQLLGGTLIEVATAALSKLSGRPEAVREQYLRFVFLAASVTMPLFVGIAATATELMGVLFGPAWRGSAGPCLWLCLLGGVQVVQFFNGAVLASAGRSDRILVINVAKAVSALAMLTLVPGRDADATEIAFWFFTSQLLVSPLSFAFASRQTGATVRQILVAILPGAIAAMAAFVLVDQVRGPFGHVLPSDLATLAALMLLYAAAFLAVAIVLARERLLSDLSYSIKAFRAK